LKSVWLVGMIAQIYQYTLYKPLKCYNTKLNNPLIISSRVSGAVGGAIVQQSGANRYIPESMRGQVNQAVGQSAINELSNAFSSRFK